MSHLCEALSPGRILCRTSSPNGLGVLTKAASLFACDGGLDAQRVLNCLKEREILGSTALGSGIAVPHGRFKGIQAAQLAIITLDTPVEYNAPDGLPVDLFVVMLIPPAANPQLHLDLLSQVTHLLSQPPVHTKILHSSDPQTLLKHLQQATLTI
jgi:PTS system nitrogen regulatory IIA component